MTVPEKTQAKKEWAACDATWTRLDESDDEWRNTVSLADFRALWAGEIAAGHARFRDLVGDVYCAVADRADADAAAVLVARGVLDRGELVDELLKPYYERDADGILALERFVALGWIDGDDVDEASRA